LAASGLVNGDEVFVKSVTGHFEDKNVGAQKTVRLKDAVYTGIDRNNYRILDQQTTQADILQTGYVQDMGNKTQNSAQNVSIIQSSSKNQNYSFDFMTSLTVETGLEKFVWSTWDDDYWYSDCNFTFKSQNKLTRCKPVQKKRTLAYEIKNYSTKKYSALNNDFMKATVNKSD
jgi:hypothetical protein